MATGDIGACFPPAKPTSASVAASREQAAVSLTENIAHDYSDGDRLMNT